MSEDAVSHDAWRIDIRRVDDTAVSVALYVDDVLVAEGSSAEFADALTALADRVDAKRGDIPRVGYADAPSSIQEVLG